MAGQSELRENRWKILADIPSKLLDGLVGAIQGVDDNVLRQLGVVLSQCDTEDFAKLRQTSSKNVSSVHEDMSKVAEEKDSIGFLRRYLDESPIESTLEKDNIEYFFRSRAESVKKRADVSKTVTGFSLLYDTTITYENRYVTVPWLYEGQIGHEKPKNVQPLIKRLRDRLCSEFSISPYRRPYSQEAKWRQICLAIYSVLWDSHEIGKEVRKNLAIDSNTRSWFDGFDAEFLEFARTFMSFHNLMSYEIIEDNSIAFVFRNGDFNVFTENDGVYEINDPTLKDKELSALYKKLQLAKTLMT